MKIVITNTTWQTDFFTWWTEKIKGVNPVTLEAGDRIINKLDYEQLT